MKHRAESSEFGYLPSTPLPQRPPIIIGILHYPGPLVTMHEPVLIHLIKAPDLHYVHSLRSTSCGFWPVDTVVHHHHSVVQNNFMALKMSCAPPLPSPRLPPYHREPLPGKH